MRPLQVHDKINNNNNNNTRFTASFHDNLDEPVLDCSGTVVKYGVRVNQLGQAFKFRRLDNFFYLPFLTEVFHP